MVRILGGRLKGRIIKTPQGTQTRPTTSLLRKALFDILQDKIEGARFLDLFAGSGAIGIEALSRGAQHVTFVESHRDAFSCIQKNLFLFQLHSQATSFFLDTFKALKKLEMQKQHFEIIYADPPYFSALIHRLLNFLNFSSLLSKNALLFIEKPLTPCRWDHHFHNLILIDERRFGSSFLDQYRKVSDLLPSPSVDNS